MRDNRAKQGGLPFVGAQARRRLAVAMTAGTEEERERNIGQKLAAGYTAELVARPLQTKMLTNLLSAIIADVIKQGIEAGCSLAVYDPSRTAALAIFGAGVAAPIAHQWFPVLDRVFPMKGEEDLQRGGQVVAKRVAADQLFMTPIFMSLFLAFMSVWETGGVGHVTARVARDLPAILPLNWLIWSPVHAITFSVVPERLRVLWISVVNLFWGTVLSGFSRL